MEITEDRVRSQKDKEGPTYLLIKHKKEKGKETKTKTIFNQIIDDKFKK